jgi:hypothetical protein
MPGGTVPRSHRFVRMLTLSAGVAGFAAAGARPVEAQGITFTPYVGSFYAVASFIEAETPAGEAISVDQANTATFGARLSVPISGSLSVEGAFAYSKSDVILRVANSCTDIATGTSLFDCSTNFSGSVIIGSGRLLVRPRRSNLYGILGVSYVNHGGDAWDDPSTEETSDIGGVVGFGLRASVTSKFTLSMTAEAHIYSFDPDADGDLFDSKTQQDLLFTVGIPISFSR